MFTALIIIVLVQLSFLLYSFGTMIALNKVLKAILSIIVAEILVSIVFCVSLVLHVQFLTAVIASLAICSAALVILTSKNKISLRPRFSAVTEPGQPGLVFLSLVMLGASMLTLNFISKSRRWGEWDAWAIWNIHAKFLTYDNYWQNLFRRELAWSHPDYPLMLPSFVAMFWKASGTFSPVVPSALAYIIAIFTPVVVALALRAKQHYILPVLALTLFIFNANYTYQSSLQYADTLLALLLVVTFILMDDCGNSIVLPFLLGFFAGFCGWVKNEGLMYFAVVSLGLIAANWRRPALLARYFAGAALPLCIIASFKYHYAPANAQGDEQSVAAMLGQLKDSSRYRLVLGNLFETITGSFRVEFCIAVLFCIAYKFRLLFDRTIIMLFLFIVVFFYPYIVAPGDLKWRLQSSGTTLFTQLYPSFIYGVFAFVQRQAPLRLVTFRARCL